MYMWLVTPPKTHPSPRQHRENSDIMSSRLVWVPHPLNRRGCGTQVSLGRADGPTLLDIDHGATSSSMTTPTSSLAGQTLTVARGERVGSGLRDYLTRGPTNGPARTKSFCTQLRSQIRRIIYIITFDFFCSIQARLTAALFEYRT